MPFFRPGTPTFQRSDVLQARIKLWSTCFGKNAYQFQSCLYKVNFAGLKTKVDASFVSVSISFTRFVEYQVCPCVFYGWGDFFGRKNCWVDVMRRWRIRFEKFVAEKFQLGQKLKSTVLDNEGSVFKPPERKNNPWLYKKLEPTRSKEAMLSTEQLKAKELKCHLSCGYTHHHHTIKWEAARRNNIQVLLFFSNVHQSIIIYFLSNKWLPLPTHTLIHQKYSHFCHPCFHSPLANSTSQLLCSLEPVNCSNNFPLHKKCPWIVWLSIIYALQVLNYSLERTVSPNHFCSKYRFERQELIKTLLPR